MHSWLRAANPKHRHFLFLSNCTEAAAGMGRAQLAPALTSVSVCLSSSGCV